MLFRGFANINSIFGMRILFKTLDFSGSIWLSWPDYTADLRGLKDAKDLLAKPIRKFLFNILKRVLI